MLPEISPEDLQNYAAQVKALAADPAYADDARVLLTIQQAYNAMAEGNPAVGAVLVDGEGRVVLEGRCRVFYPQFRSDLHAEMDVLNEFERNAAPAQTLRGYTLYSSLEPCEMCMIRLITSGISRVLYAAKDAKGKTDRRDEWADHWRHLAEKQEFAPAQCAPRLRELAWELFAATGPRSTAKLLARR